MARFVETIEPADVRAEFADAIDGKGAFSRFRRTLNQYPELKEVWHTYRQKCRAASVRYWLAREGYRVDVTE